MTPRQGFGMFIFAAGLSVVCGGVYILYGLGWALGASGGALLLLGTIVVNWPTSSR